MFRSRRWALSVLGFLLIATCIWGLMLGDLRENTIQFEYLFFSAFILYAMACFLVLGMEETMDRKIIIGIFAAAILMQAILIFTRPSLSDDMYRYVWDGRVQAQGISPYRFPPQAPELTFLRDSEIYPSINRKFAVTIYPPAAEAGFALFWRIWPDNYHWFQGVMATGGLLAGILLLGLLSDLNLSPGRVLVTLWSPLLAFETAHSAHVDGLVLPFIVGAWWARIRERESLTGFLLGIGTAIKLYPALLLPFLWNPRTKNGWWRMPGSFAVTVVSCYLPYVLISGKGVVGYLPKYLKETFNVSPLVSAVNRAPSLFNAGISNTLILFALGMIIATIWTIMRPTHNAKTALKRCILPIGIVTLFSQDLFPWYMLWLLPLVSIFMKPSNISLGILKFPRLDAWTGWWLFCGLIGLSYTFFINRRHIETATLFQFLPLYLFLFIDFARSRGIRAPAN